MNLRLWLGLAALVLGACGGPGRANSTTDFEVPTKLTESVPSSTSTTAPPAETSTTQGVSPVPWRSASITDREPSPASPVSLTIPVIDVSAPVVGLGVDEQGQMDVPDNVSEVAWYRFGASPGQPGSAVLAAHVDLASQGPGVFFDIDELEPGDEVTVGFDDGSTMALSVVRTERVAKASLDVDALFARTGEPTIRLVTCGGGFNPQLGRYDDNVIVTLVPVGSPP